MNKTILRKALTKSAKKKNIRKRSIRFSPDPMTLGYIDYETTGSFSPHTVVIILNESYSGCALIMATDNKIKNDQKLKIKIGNLDPVNAEVVWFKLLEENIYKVGLKILD